MWGRAAVCLLVVCAGGVVDVTAVSADGDTLSTYSETVRHGSSPFAADTDGDGLDDAREVELGTRPTAVDTDGDGLTDAREVRIGTSPTDADTDGDWLRDGWEVAGEAPNGLAIPESDPLHRDLYVDIVELRGATGLSPRDVARLREEFAAMPVENPDGERGIRLHVAGPRRVDVSVRDLHDRTDYETAAVTRRHLGEVLYTTEQMGQRRGVSHLVAVVPPETDLHNAGRGFAVWKLAAVTDPTTRVVVHELLHTITDPEAFAQSCNGQSHTCRGYLSYTSDTHFSKATTAWLANNSYGNNDAEVGGKTYRDP